MTERVGESDLDAQERGLKSLDVAHTSVVTAVAEVEGRAARTRPRSSWSRLFSDGLVLGSHNDEKDLRSVAEGRKVLRRLTAPTAPEPAPALAARPALELVAA